MKKTEILKIYHALIHKNRPSIFNKPIKLRPQKQKSTKRPNSVSIEDAFFGDSGKGSVVVKFNNFLAKHKKFYSCRYNGGSNAGHETVFHGKKIVTHQLPIGIINKEAVVFMLRGMVIHPVDLVTEIHRIRNDFGGKIPGKLIIDERTPLALDTHRAFESLLNIHSIGGGKGSTGRGIAMAYGSLYGRYPVFLKDLMRGDWKDIFCKHYRLYQQLIQGFDVEIKKILVPLLGVEKGAKREVGSEKEFIDRLEEGRSTLKPYISSLVYSLLENAWKDIHTPFTIEGAQGIGLDPYHGVYPDVTASRPASRNINDATYNIILPDEIAIRAAVMKTTYISSVGQRKLPTVQDERYEKWVQETFDEKGRSTGRLRDIYPISLPIAAYLRKAAGYKYLVATHLDASESNIPIRVITHYTDKKTGKETAYMPYQDALDNLEPHVVEFPGWDGEEVKNAKTPKNLPYNTRVYLAFLSQSIAPLILGTTGADIEDSIFFIENKKLHF